MKFLLLLAKLWLKTEKIIEILKTKGSPLLLGYPEETSPVLLHRGHIYLVLGSWNSIF